MKVTVFSDNADWFVQVNQGDKVIFSEGNSELAYGCANIEEIPLEEAPEWVQKEVEKALTS